MDCVSLVVRRHRVARSRGRRLVACSSSASARPRTICSSWQAAGNRIASRLGIASVIRIVELPHIDVPLVVGCLRPIVVLPIAAISQLSAAQVEAILAHELAHVRRHDYLVNLMQTIAETLLFYHPAVWWLSARIRDEREHCCDDVALEEIFERYKQDVITHAMQVPSPRYFGQFNPTPLPIGVWADALTSSLNQNAGAWRNGPTSAMIEARVIRWLCELVGYDEKSFGTLASGGTEANLIALKCARDRTHQNAVTEGLRSAPLLWSTHQSKCTSQLNAVSTFLD